MSGIGVGSKEMHSALVDNGQLQLLNVMLNDLKTKIGYVTSYHDLLKYTYVDPTGIWS
jgi:hypothetical protein